jgi:Uma2 family endonuclease
MNAVEPHPYRWTRDEYYKLCESEWFLDKRVQLIGGEIVEMSAQKHWHAWSLKATEVALSAAFGANYWVRGQMTLDLSPYSAPDPDVAVIAGSHATHRLGSTPTTALLVVEVSETTLGYDRHHKSSLYAASGIADYWIVNLVQRQLEVYRNPVPDATRPFGFGYADRTILDPGDVVSPLAAPQATVAVSDLLP